MNRETLSAGTGLIMDIPLVAAQAPLRRVSSYFVQDGGIIPLFAEALN
jgi:hypothetical protein